MTGNQYTSRKAYIMFDLSAARDSLRLAAATRHDADLHGRYVSYAQSRMFYARCAMAAAPASTRRRWKAGR